MGALSKKPAILTESYESDNTMANFFELHI